MEARPCPTRQAHRQVKVSAIISKSGSLRQTVQRSGTSPRPMDHCWSHKIPILPTWRCFVGRHRKSSGSVVAIGRRPQSKQNASEPCDSLVAFAADGDLVCFEIY